VERVLCRFAGWGTGSRKGGGTALRRKVEDLARRFLDQARPGDFNQAMMELGATVCTPRNPQCAACPLMAECKTRGEHKTTRRAAMTSRVAAYALVMRATPRQGRRRGGLVQRPAHTTVMPGMWELPTLVHAEVPGSELRMTLRHAIMQVNYYVHIRSVGEEDVEAVTAAGGERRWVALHEAGSMALTGLTRKVLMRARLLASPAMDAIARRRGEAVV
jgi:A/G-specific adenine glycosylase